MCFTVIQNKKKIGILLHMSAASHIFSFQSRKALTEIKKWLSTYKWQIKACKELRRKPTVSGGIFLVDFSEDFSFWKFIAVIFNSLFIVLHITISNLEKLTVSLKHIIKEHV